MCKTKRSIQNSCLPFDTAFCDKFVDCEKYIALQSASFKDLFNWDPNGKPEEYDGIVRIRKASDNGFCKNYLYRKAVGHAAGNFTKNQVMIGHRSRKMLDVQLNDEVIIEPACWFLYLWNHADSTIRYPFRVAIIFGIISIVLGIGQLH